MSIVQSTVLAPSLDYKKLEYSGSSLGFRKIFPNETASFDLAPTGTSEQFIEIPSEKVFNLSKSRLVFNQSTAASGGGNYNWLYEDSISPISELDIITESGTKLMQMRWAQNFTNMVRPYMTPFPEFESLEQIGRLYKSNALVTAVSGIRPIGGSASVNYVEKSYLQVGGDNGALAQYCQIPLSAYQHNITAVDKLLYFGEKLTIRLGFGPGAKVGFLATSATNPTTGAAALAVNTTISGLCLYLATEEDQALVAKLKSQVEKSGLTLLCPLATVYRKTFQAATSQIAAYQFLPSFQKAKYLQRIYHAVYSATESANTAYDHSNVNGAKVSSYNTYLNGDQRVQFSITCSTATLLDYMVNEKFIKGTAITNANQYQYNWVHIDDFTNLPAAGDASIAPRDNQMAGLAFNPDIKWEFNATTANTAFNHYTVIVTQGILKITPGNTNWA